MFKPDKKLLIFIAFLLFTIAVVLSLLFHTYELAVSGMLIFIVLTAFIPGWQSTLIAGFASMIAMTILVLYFKDNNINISRALLSQVYSLLSILFTVVLIFYLKKMQDTFAQEKTHMTSLFENATEGILLTNREGQIILVNPAAEKMFQYPAVELIGQRIETMIPSRFRPQHHGLRENYHQHPKNRTMGTGKELFATRKDGTELPVEISLSHYKQRNEQFVIAFVIDITERKQAEKNSEERKQELEKISADIRKLNAELEGKVEERTVILKDALQKLEQSQNELNESLAKEKYLNEIKSRFVSMASHEFRTPLSTILSSATLISKYPTADEFEKREKHIRRIRDSVTHMNELLEDFLSLGKLEEGKVSINASTFSLKEFLDDVADEMRAFLKNKQEFVFDCSGDETFSTDKRMLKNILLNLLSNAIKFSPEDKLISIKSTNTKAFLTIAITDKGLGIPKEDQPFLFSTFFRAKNVNDIQGTGLGLPIVMRYATLLKGKISFVSDLGVGTTFTLELPSMSTN